MTPRRCRPFTPLLVCLLPAVAAAASSNALPPSEELERAGARVGEITILPGDIFDTTDPDEDTAVHRLTNRLHVTTQESTIRSQLLFAPGDLYSAQVLAESERALRRQRYLREPVIRPIAWHDGVVDVEVRSGDQWTTSPEVSLSRAGGKNGFGAALEEHNLMGWGKSLSLEYLSDVDRDVFGLRWIDPAVRGSRWINQIELAKSSDGHLWTFAVERPFFALATPWSAGVAVVSRTNLDDRYSLGEKVDDYRVDHAGFELQGGVSSGLHDGWVRRWSGGYRYDRSRFYATATPLVGPLPADRTLGYPFARFELLRDDFATTRNLQQIGRTEDEQFGTHVTAELGWAAPAFGSDENALIPAVGVSRGFRLPNAQSLFLAGNWGARVASGELQDSLVSASARYFFRTSPRTLLYANVAADAGTNLDLDHQLLLGGDSGLRGYPLRYQTGTSRALATVEARFYSDWYPFHLTRVGAAVFADAGRVWGTSAVDVPQLGTLKDVGFGLRFANSRSSLGNVIHVDVAFPLDGDSSIASMQFLIQTRQTF